MPDLPSKAVCIFDFDGTLVDSMNSFADLAADLMAVHFGVSRQEAREDYLRTSGLPFFQQLETLRPDDNRNAKIAELFEAGKQLGYFECPFFSEVPEAISRLQEKGIRVVVSSNNGQAIVEEYLQKKPKPRFDLVLGFKKDFSKGQAHFQAVMKHFKLKPEDLLFVGDSLHDAHQAQECGIDFVGRIGTFSVAEFRRLHNDVTMVHSLDELIGVLCK